MTDDKYKPQRKYNQRQAERGMVSVRVWVPADKAGMVTAYAEKLRKEHKLCDPKN